MLVRPDIFRFIAFALVCAAAFCLLVWAVACFCLPKISRFVDRRQLRPSVINGVFQIFGGGYLLVVALNVPFQITVPTFVCAIVSAILIATGLERILIAPAQEFLPRWYLGEGNADWLPPDAKPRFSRRISLLWVVIATLTMCTFFAGYSWRFKAQRLAAQKYANAVARILEWGGTVSQQTVSLSGTEVTDEGLEILADLGRIRDLNLGATEITNEGLRHIMVCRNDLQSLDLSGTQVNDEGVRQLSALKRLVLLRLRQTRVTGTAFPEASRRLIILDLSLCPVTKSGIARVTMLRSLQHLYINETKLSDAMIEELQKLDLKSLDLRDCGLSQASISAIEAAHPKTIVLK